MNFLINNIISFVKGNRLVQIALVLALLAVFSGALLWIQGSYYKTRQKIIDAKTQKEIGKLKLENDKLSRQSETLKEEIQALQKAVDSKATAADKRAQEIVKEAQEDRAKIEADYNNRKAELDKVFDSAGECEKCHYVCELYKRNNLTCPTDCEVCQ